MYLINQSLIFLSILIPFLPQTASTPSSTSPLSKIHHPISSSLKIRHLQSSQISKRSANFQQDQPIAHDSRFIISFSLPVSSDPDSLEAELELESIHLSLRPSSNFLHPAKNSIKLTTFPSDSASPSISHLSREELLVYEGTVFVGDGEEAERWFKEEEIGVVKRSSERERIRGRARVVIGEEGMEGMFWVEGRGMGKEVHHIKSLSSYLSTRHSLDPIPHPSILSRRETFLSKRSSSISKRGYLTLQETSEDLESSLVILKDADVLPISPDSEIGPICKTNMRHPTSQPLYDLGSLHSPASPPPYPPHDFHILPSSSSSSLHPHLLPRQADSSGDIAGTTNTSNFINSIGSIAGCPIGSGQEVTVFMGLAADCTYVITYGSEQMARTMMLSDLNNVAEVYKGDFGVNLGVTEMIVVNSTCPTTQSEVTSSGYPWNVGCQEDETGLGLSLDDRLSAFSSWRGTHQDDAGVWHLLTNCTSGSEVGVAWLGLICDVGESGSEGQVSSGTAVTAVSRYEWQVVAHEVGHNFGSIHDCTDGCSLSGGCCPLTTSTCDADDNFIMSPVSVNNVSSFSQCTLGNICSAYASTLNTSCFHTTSSVTTTLLTLNECGNGIVEEGEECDTGGIASSCCTSQCQFTTGSVCEPSNSVCCTDTCGFAAAGTVCRESIDERCDYTEVCTGTAATCPTDKYKSDGTSCGSGLQCATGLCTSRSLQCAQQGASLNITTSCGSSTSSTCQLTCADPSNSNDCIVMESDFRNGIDCGFAGHCLDGRCSHGKILDEIESWYKNNLKIAIPCTVAAVLLILAIIALISRCCARMCLRRRLRREARFAAAKGIPPDVNNSMNIPPPLITRPSVSAEMPGRRRQPSRKIQQRMQDLGGGAGAGRPSLTGGPNRDSGSTLVGSDENIGKKKDSIGGDEGWARVGNEMVERSRVGRVRNERSSGGGRNGSSEDYGRRPPGSREFQQRSEGNQWNVSGQRLEAA